jgi:hypothetical protein
MFLLFARLIAFLAMALRSPNNTFRRRFFGFSVMSRYVYRTDGKSSALVSVVLSTCTKPVRPTPAQSWTSCKRYKNTDSRRRRSFGKLRLGLNWTRMVRQRWKNVSSCRSRISRTHNHSFTVKLLLVIDFSRPQKLKSQTISTVWS